MKTEVPIVFCHGLLGWGSNGNSVIPYFAAVEKLKNKEKDNLPRFIYSSTGPFSSLHDQVCELFFQLKGGLTDYGEEHSSKAGHKRYSRQYDNPQYPQWDSNHPLHFVGHSMGGPLIRVLQYYLQEDYFYKYCGFKEHTKADWIRSVTTIAGVHNGSTLTWLLGADEETGLLKDDAKLVRFLGRLLERVGCYQNKKTEKKFIYDLHLDQWDIENTDNVKTIVSQLSSKIGFDGTDWAMYDLTPNSLSNYNSFLKEYDCTYYFSIRCLSTFSFFGHKALPIPFICHWILLLNSIGMGFYKVKNEKWKNIEKKFHLNDGMCPTESQKYPFLGQGGQPSYVNIDIKNGFAQRGKWNVIQNVPLMDHSEPTMIPHLLRFKKSMKLYKKLIDFITELK